MIRHLVYKLAQKAGMPSKVLQAGIRFQVDANIRNAIVGGLGEPYGKKCGLPQGDPLSMVMVALLMRV